MKKPGNPPGDRNKAEEALRLDESRLEALLKLDEMAEAPLQDITRFAMEEGVRLTNSRIGYLAFVNDDETVLTMHSWSRAAMAECQIEDKPIVYPRETVGLWGEAVRQRKPVVTNDYQSPNPWKKGCPDGHVPMTRHMNVPVFDGRKIVAVAGVGNKREPYDDSDVRQLQLLMDGMWRLLQRKWTAEALRQNEEKFKRLIETTGTGYVIIDDRGRVVDANLEYVRMTGRLRLEEILGYSVLDWTAPNDLDRNGKEVKKCLARGSVRGFEVDYVAPDGRVTPIEVNATVLRSAGTVRILTLCRDITERKRTEDALRKAKDELEQRVAERTAELSKSRERLSTLFRTSPAGIFLSRLEDGMLLEVNDAYRRLLGYTAEEMIGRTTLELGIFVNPDDRKRSIEILKRDGRNENVEVQYRHKSGRIVHLLINALPVNVDGVPCILGTSLDITERKKVETSLHRSEEMLNLIFQHSNDGISIVELDTPTGGHRLVLCNDRYVEMTGYTRQQLFAAEDVTRLTRADNDEQETKEYNTKIAQGIPFTGRASWLRPDGKKNYFEWTACSTRVDGKTLIVGVDRDITQRKQAEEELKEANLSLARSTSRLRALTLELTRVEHLERRRIAGLLHDHLQQLLVAAKLNVAAMAQSELEERDRDSARKATAALDEAIAQSKSLAVELNPPVLREGGLAHALRWLGRRMRQTHDMAVEVEAQDDGGRIDQEFRIVLFNSVRELLFNVLKHASVKSAKVEMSMPPGRQVRIVVADRGSGFVRKVTGSANDFESGLGLLAIRERLESLGGGMEIESRPGRGSRITLTAPLRPPGEPAKTSRARRPKVRADRAAGPRIKSGAARKGIRVLLVDDHAIVRQGVAQLLSGVPEITVVAEASNGKEAIRLARKWRPDVVVMDVNMPEMNGVEATRAIHAQWPKVAVIGLSMYHEPHRAEEMRRAGAVGYVNKSEVTETLISTIRACCKKKQSLRRR